ncbi:hypothetical protein [Nocardia australiensis]|uniref:hypothetical protein n=1 Tax=Nocardia australiensis TaxID=2887191 RepID=UPI001D1377EC|nr:hypothetical protein [Nocardia australiensis]
MSEQASPLPGDPDVHLSVFLHGARFDFTACLTAALIFTHEHQKRQYADAVAVDLGDTRGYPRLPCERLYLRP